MNVNLTIPIEIIVKSLKSQEQSFSSQIQTSCDARQPGCF